VSRRREEIREALRRRVANGVHLGFLRPGQRLTSAHEVARQHSTDYRVVTAAVRALEQEGLLEVRARAGIFVGRNAARPDAVALAGLGSRLVSLLVEEVASGLPATGFPERVRHCLETVRVRTACVECNQDQLDSIFAVSFFRTTRCGSPRSAPPAPPAARGARRRGGPPPPAAPQCSGR
jgi:GntR family transcriptional regulator